MLSWISINQNLNCSKYVASLIDSPGYFHYLENPDNVNGSNVASFFGNETPEFIGLVGCLSAYSKEILASVFNKDPNFFTILPRLEKNVFIASGTG